MKKDTLYFSIQWHITSNCLNKCKHCYMYDDNYVTEDCSYDDFKLMFKNIENFFNKYNLNLPRVALTGGSPLLNPECDKILSFLYSKVSNQIIFLDIPEVLTNKNIELLKLYGISDYQMSLDGLDAVHDYIRGKGSFKKTIEACLKLSDNGIKPHIMFTLSKNNCDQLIPLCEYLSEKLESFSFAFDFVVPVGNAAQDNDYISSEQAKIIMDEYYTYAKKNTKNKQIFALKPSQYNIYEYLKNNEPIRSAYSYPMISGCHIGWDSVCILQNGDVLPCRRLPIVLGNLKNESFEDIFLNSEILRKFRRFSSYQEKCGLCQYGSACRGCPAITYALTGDCFGAFDLCTYNPSNNAKMQYTVPDINCCKEKEINFIKSSMKNLISINYNHILEMYPNLIKYVRSFKKVKNTEADYNSWLEHVNKEISIDEEYCLANLFLSPRFILNK